jgi:hypothetical protein
MATVPFTVTPSDKAINRSDNAFQYNFTQHVSAINLHSAIYNKHISTCLSMTYINIPGGRQMYCRNVSSKHIITFTNFAADGSIILAPESAVVTICTTCCNITRPLHFVHTLYLNVCYGFS